MPHIRDDLVGAIYVGGKILRAGDEVPVDTDVSAEHLASEVPAKAETVPDSAGDEVPVVKPKRGRPKKTAETVKDSVTSD